MRLEGYGDSPVFVEVTNELGKTITEETSLFIYKDPKCSGLFLSTPKGVSEEEDFDISAQNCHDGYDISNTLTYKFTFDYYLDQNDEDSGTVRNLELQDSPQKSIQTKLQGYARCIVHAEIKNELDRTL